ncbi:MAG: hypothetical protein JKY22_01280 [Flavobacteriaceae bacterium]|nr:hypothetical protein [Flavobacteriaceae bacterium]
MNRFLKNSLHFGVYLLLISLACFTVIKTTYYDKYTLFDSSFNTYLFADSHGDQLDTIMETYGIFNFSDPSDSYEDMLRKIKYTVANSEVIKIIISVDLHNLSTYREENNNLDRSSIYANKDDYDSTYDQFLQQYFRRYVPLLHGKSRDALLMHIKSLIPKPFTPKLAWNEKSNIKRTSQAKQRTDIHFDASERSEKMENLLLEIITICQENSIELQGIKFPLTTEYRMQIKGRGYVAEDILKTHSYNVVDYTKYFDGHSEYFRDQDHVNTMGALILASELKKQRYTP